MSGGSFDYLCFSDSPADAARKGNNLQRMADELETCAPGHPVTLYTKRLSEISTEFLPEPVKEVWHAVEWTCSSDWGVDQLDEVLEATKGWRPYLDDNLHEGRDVAQAYRTGLADGKRNLLAELASLTPAYADMVRAYTAAQTEQARQEHTQIPKESQ